MKPLVASFRRAASFACQRQGFAFHRFMGEHGLEPILIDAEIQDLSATSLVVRVLTECCVTDGKFNNFQVGLLTVVRFLSSQFGEPVLSHVQVFKDLIAILNNGGQPEKVQRWVESNFGR